MKVRKPARAAAGSLRISRSLPSGRPEAGPGGSSGLLANLRQFSLALFSAIAFTVGSAFAETLTPYEEIWRRSQIFQPRPSFDTTPVSVKVVSAIYRIPRNYLTHLEPAIPTLKVTWPGLKPLSEETRDCFDPKWQVHNKSCTTIEFRLLGSRGPGPGGWALTNTEKFENFKRNTPGVKARPGPFGYDIYDVGPDDARTEVYRRAEGDIFFRCYIDRYRGVRGGVCHDMFRLYDMNHVQFHFRLHQIKHIPEIENAIRELVVSFATGTQE